MHLKNKCTKLSVIAIGILFQLNIKKKKVSFFKLKQVCIFELYWSVCLLVLTFLLHPQQSPKWKQESLWLG